MNYYKVKTTSDQVKASIRFKNDFLISCELYTPLEIQKAIDKGHINQSFVAEHFERLEVAPRKTYFFFGARRTTVN